MNVKARSEFDASSATAQAASGLPTISLSGPVDEFDFTKYRGPELVTRIADIASLPAAIEMMVKWSGIGVVAVWIGLPLLFAERVQSLVG